MNWNGEERRQINWNNAFWREITEHMAVTNKTLKELIDKITIQNGRITKLEHGYWFVAGAAAIVTLLINIFIKH